METKYTASYILKKSVQKKSFGEREKNCPKITTENGFLVIKSKNFCANVVMCLLVVEWKNRAHAA